MRVPLEWLKEYVAIEETADDIATRLTMGGLEVEGNEPPDEVFAQAIKKQIPGEIARAAADLGRVLDVYVTPNRGDCLSMVGVAREVSALYGLPLHIPSPPFSTDEGPTAKQTSVTVEDHGLCPRYAARLVHGVRVGPSPQWLQARLAAAGQRPINNVVDITNYVMLELGQPLHAFDLHMLSGNRIVVRRARPGELLKTLDGVERELTSSMLVVADAEQAVALAGIMGGEHTEVSDGTTSLLIESAHFDPLSVRRTSRALGLRSEASYRFERVVDPDGVRRAVDRACQLLTEIGQPAAEKGIIDIYPHRQGMRELSLRVARVHALLGMEVPSHAAADSLRALGFDVHTEAHGKTDTLQVHVPTFRADVQQEADLVEEVGRIYGYENIPETLPFGNTTLGGDSAFGEFLMRVRRSLVACGLQEVITHSLSAPSFFDSPDDAARRVSVRNSLSADMSGLRRSLLPTLIGVAEHNRTRGMQDLALFEAGRVWQTQADGDSPMEIVAIGGLLTGAVTEKGWQHEPRPLIADYSLAHGIVERLLRDLKVDDYDFEPLGDRETTLPQFHPGRSAVITLNGEVSGVVGEAHPRLSQSTGLRERVILFELSCEALQSASRADVPRYRPFSRYPAVVRDLAPRLAETIPYGVVDAVVRAARPAILEEFRLTDVFRGSPLPDDIKSLTLSFTFRALDRTLAETEINEALEVLRYALGSSCAATFP